MKMELKEIVKPMKEGKRFKTPNMGCCMGIEPGRDTFRFYELDGTLMSEAPISYTHAEATDWEVIDEEEWNLKEFLESRYFFSEHKPLLDNVKMCRDKILKDIRYSDNEECRKAIIARFGKL